jgi:hypothetical protein
VNATAALLLRLGVGLSVTSALLCEGRPAFAVNQQAELEKVRAVFLSKNYVEVENRLVALLDPQTGTLREALAVAQGRMYLGAAQVLLGKRPAATAVFEALLREDPQYDPDPLTFPYPVTDLFIDTRAKIREQLRVLAELDAKRAAEQRAQAEAERQRSAARTKRLEELASQESVAVTSQRWRALLPFGIGQFQNRQNPLGYVFLMSESMLLAANIATVPFYISANNSKDTYASTDQLRAQGYKVRAEGIRIANLSLAAGFIATWITGVVQAQIAYVPQFKETRPRTLPTLAIAPYVVPTLTGATAGIGGVF